VPITDSDGTLQSLLRVYNAEIEPGKKALPPVLPIKGASIRLFAAETVLGIAQGIETALAAHEIFHLPVWSKICADAYAAANRLSRCGLNVTVRLPPHGGVDWLDVLVSGATPP
jgi:putative DNA primase/helicase